MMMRCLANGRAIFGREYATCARWSSPDVWLTGKAKTAAAADLQVVIFRTVSFDTK